MEKKTAIVVIDKQNFYSEGIFKCNNDERIAWFACLVDEDISIKERCQITRH